MKTIMVRCAVPFECDLTKIEQYLLKMEWKETEKYGPYGRTFRKGGDVVVLLSTYDVGDFNQRMAEFVIELAEAEGRPAREIIKDLEAIDERST